MKKSILAAALGAVLAAGVMMSPMAHADTDSTFLQQLASAGIGPPAGSPDYLVQAYITEAHTVCTWQNTPGQGGAVMEHKPFQVLTLAQANQFVAITRSTYCPGS